MGTMHRLSPDKKAALVEVVNCSPQVSRIFTQDIKSARTNEPKSVLKFVFFKLLKNTAAVISPPIEKRKNKSVNIPISFIISLVKGRDAPQLIATERRSSSAFLFSLFICGLSAAKPVRG